MFQLATGSEFYILTILKTFEVLELAGARENVFMTRMVRGAVG